MGHTTLAAILTVILLALPASADGPSTKPTELVLLDRPLSNNGDRLVVVRGPDMDPALFDFWKSPQIDQIGKLYEIRVEARAPNKPSLLLATHLHTENKLSPLMNQEFVVMDALVEPGVIVMATSAGGNVELWRIQAFGAPPTSWLRLDWKWNRYAAPMPLNNNLVDVKLSRAAGGPLTLDILDKRGNAPHTHTIYQQTHYTDSKLELVRQWQDQ